MGYYTAYTLESPHDESIIAELKNFSSDADYALDKYGETAQTCKWYEHVTELKQFSLNYPNTLFVLSGEGEDNFDIWKFYVKNGRGVKYKALVIYPDFVETDLT